MRSSSVIIGRRRRRDAGGGHYMEWPIGHMGYHMRMAKDRPDRYALRTLGSGALIREARRLAGLTQAELARRLATTQSAVSNWERGRDTPRVDTLARILEACGFEADMTFRRHDDVDRAQIRQNLAMTPAERLESVRNVSRLRSRARAVEREPARA
jgi:transcriptional regulator with XRE-family HTH domain